MKVVLFAPSAERIKESDILQMWEDEMFYAIALVGQPVLSKKYTIPFEESHRSKTDTSKLSPADRVPHTHYEYNQACVLYGTKEDYEKGEGVWQPYLPDILEEMPWEYIAKIID
jgi:hypothetical protein